MDTSSKDSAKFYNVIECCNITQRVYTATHLHAKITRICYTFSSVACLTPQSATNRDFLRRPPPFLKTRLTSLLLGVKQLECISWLSISGNSPKLNQGMFTEIEESNTPKRFILPNSISGFSLGMSLNPEVRFGMFILKKKSIEKHVLGMFT